ncbi:hypothetical protein [Streptomyces sp. NPDC002221]
MAAGTATAQALGPILMTTLIISWGSPGWLVPGTVFVTTGWTARAVTQRARRRPPTNAQTLPVD